MPSKRSILLKLKHGSFRTVLGAARLVPGAASERLLQDRLISQNNNDTDRLMSLAWAAEEADDLALAVRAWFEVSQIAAAEDTKNDTFKKATQKFVVLETKLRKRVLATGKVSSEAIWTDGPAIPVKPNALLKQKMRPSLAKNRAKFLHDLWNNQISKLSDVHQTALRRAYAVYVTPLIKRRQFKNARIALQPLLTQWPSNQVGQRLYLRCLTDHLAEDAGKGFSTLEAWWGYYRAHPQYFNEKTEDQMQNQFLRTARKMIADKRADDAERLIMPAFQNWPDTTSMLGLLAEASEIKGDWRACADRWQLMAAVSNPVTTKSRTHVAQNVEEMTRRTKHASNQLRRARVKLARDLRKQRKRREFGELVNRIVETIPDQRVLKKERSIVDLVRIYVQDALRDDGVETNLGLAKDNKPLRIAICLDVLKISDVHTHSRVVYAICRNLMEMNPDIETHVFVTNERFAVTTPVVASSFNPVREDKMADGAKAALPEFFGSRFFLHVFRNSGLEGLVDTCKSIIDIAPDVILYGGGHRGLFSNESRLIRHCLYDYFPTAFFYIQANNEVDNRLDTIIARGPHQIEGNPGNAEVLVQPYPTIVEKGFVNEVPIDMSKHARKHIVSAITGVRMDVRMKEIDPSEMKLMMSILDRVPGAVWHLIGAADPEEVITSNPLIKERVEAGQMVVHPVLPFEEFTELVGHSSLFFHIPGFTGGSGGATVARRGGIPIVTFKHSDVSGRQPAETVFDSSDLAGAVEKSISLLNDGNEWRKTVEAQFEHTNWILKTSASGFYDCLSKTMERSQSRLDPNIIQLRDKKKDDAGRRSKLSVV